MVLKDIDNLTIVIACTKDVFTSYLVLDASS